MNANRRKDIASLIARIEDLAGKMEEISSDISTLLDEEQEYYDNMPESLQGGEKGERAQEAISALEEAINTADAFDFSDLTDTLETAAA